MAANDERFFDDITLREPIDCGSIDVTKDEMLDFAERYDPQPIHVDEVAARESMYGELIASGWLTCALTARLLFGNGLDDVASVGARGVDDLRWRRPVHAGDTLSVTIEFVEKDTGDNPNFGQVIGESVTTNQEDKPVLTSAGRILVAKAGTD